MRPVTRARISRTSFRLGTSGVKGFSGATLAANNATELTRGAFNVVYVPSRRELSDAVCP